MQKANYDLSERLDLGITLMEEGDREIDRINKLQQSGPCMAAIRSRRSRRNDEMDSGMFSTRIEPDLNDLMKRQGFFSEPTALLDWDVFKRRLEKLFTE